MELVLTALLMHVLTKLCAAAGTSIGRQKLLILPAVGRGAREERRSGFVAITRASETLTLTYAQAYRGWLKRPTRV